MIEINKVLLLFKIRFLIPMFYGDFIFCLGSFYGGG